jgi:hypothetical protein
MAITEPVAKRAKLAFLVHDFDGCLLPAECKAKTREKIMASVEISLRALTVSRQRVSGILLKRCCTRFGHQVTPMYQVACLTFALPGVTCRTYCGS